VRRLRAQHGMQERDHSEHQRDDKLSDHEEQAA
jgi:hypothetical protein